MSPIVWEGDGESAPTSLVEVPDNCRIVVSDSDPFKTCRFTIGVEKGVVDGRGFVFIDLMSRYFGISNSDRIVWIGGNNISDNSEELVKALIHQGGYMSPKDGSSKLDTES